MAGWHTLFFASGGTRKTRFRRRTTIRDSGSTRCERGLVSRHTSTAGARRSAPPASRAPPRAASCSLRTRRAGPIGAATPRRRSRHARCSTVPLSPAVLGQGSRWTARKEALSTANPGLRSSQFRGGVSFDARSAPLRSPHTSRQPQKRGCHAACTRRLRVTPRASNATTMFWWRSRAPAVAQERPPPHSAPRPRRGLGSARPRPVRGHARHGQPARRR